MLTTTSRDPNQAAFTSLLGDDVGRLLLEVRHDQTSQLVSITGPKAVIGSGERCDIRFASDLAQPVEVIILRGTSQTTVRRWSAQALLNGQAFDDATLQVGDLLACGDLTIEVIADSHDETDTELPAAAQCTSHDSSEPVDGPPEPIRPLDLMSPADTADSLAEVAEPCGQLTGDRAAEPHLIEDPVAHMDRTADSYENAPDDARPVSCEDDDPFAALRASLLPRKPHDAPSPAADHPSANDFDAALANHIDPTTTSREDAIDEPAACHEDEMPVDDEDPFVALQRRLDAAVREAHEKDVRPHDSDGTDAFPSRRDDQPVDATPVDDVTNEAYEDPFALDDEQEVDALADDDDDDSAWGDSSGLTFVLEEAADLDNGAVSLSHEGGEDASHQQCSLEACSPINAVTADEFNTPTDEETYAPTDEEAYAPTDEEAYAPTDEEAYAPTDEEAYAPTDEEAYAPTDEEAYAPTDEEAYAPTDEEAYAPTDEEAYAPADEEAYAVTEDDAYDDDADERFDLDTQDELDDGLEMAESGGTDHWENSTDAEDATAWDEAEPLDETPSESESEEIAYFDETDEERIAEANGELSEDGSIEDYMRKLLERVGTDPSLAPSAETASKGTAPTKSSAGATQAAKKDPKKSQWPLAKTKSMPERITDLAAMRELANESARTAISQHTATKHQTIVKNKLFSAAALGLAAGILLILSNLRANLLLFAGIMLLGVATHSVLQGLKSTVVTTGLGGKRPAGRRKSRKSRKSRKKKSAQSLQAGNRAGKKRRKSAKPA